MIFWKKKKKPKQQDENDTLTADDDIYFNTMDGFLDDVETGVIDDEDF